MSAYPAPDAVNDPALDSENTPTLVLIHGALNDHTVWSPQITGLARHARVLAPDLPGHGTSPGPALASIEAMADWLLDYLDKQGIARATLAGHSMGSLIALEAASRQPERVGALILLGSTWPMAVAPALLDKALHDEAAAIALVAKWSHTPSSAGTALVDEAIALMTRLAAAQPGLLHVDLAACAAYANGETAARAIACPVTLVAGSADRMTPTASTERLRAALDQPALVELACGHQMMAEQPEAVLAALSDALVPELDPAPAR